ncbi:MAG: spermine synthase [Candidatus Nitrohelix vancouverensis]|uniref:Polyamine aminopropyltransferase n=1 Tax=Candidatus Nitrohelix vancouverensis TaxID=2705534 RepID=A0A7T0C512_9BACT|nr:MAG: spermine synthase [Candidatus Nitrohelix vancouverensis]
MIRNPATLTIISLCVLISGAASLTYELIWVKQLTLIYGSAVHAISAALCAFMAGLGLGAWLISLLLKRLKDSYGPHFPLLLYGLFEGAIGLYGYVFPWALEQLASTYPSMLAVAGESTFALHFMEFIASAALMLPATLMMGATLPLLGDWFIQNRESAILPQIARLYWLNTLGAAFGCVYGQLIAVEWFGVRGTTLSAVLANTLVMAIIVATFFILRRSPDDDRVELSESPSESSQAPDEQISKSIQWMALALFIYSGMVALSAEILWTRILVFPLGSALHSFALILATFLFGIALGSWLAGKIPLSKNSLQLFLFIEIAIGAVCLLQIPFFNQLTEWTQWSDRLLYELDNTASQTLLVRSLFAFGFMLLPTLGFGMAFPLANRMHLSLFGSIDKTIGGAYAANTLGATLGTVLTPFLLIPLLGIRASLFVIFALLLFFSLCIETARRRWSSSRQLLAASVVLFALAASGASILGGQQALEPGQNNFARLEINVPKERIKLLDYKEGDFSTLSVVEDSATGARTLYVNGFSTATASDSIGGSAYMQAMGFVPMVLHPAPKKAMVICYGTGATLGTVALFPDASVDGVEIDGNVLSLSHWFTRWNRQALDRSNVSMKIQDGRSYMRWTDAAYDVITLEPMSPVQAGVVNLYSKEFYEQAAQRLNEGGLMMQWLPLHLVSPEDARSIIKTFQDVFPYTSVWNSFLTRIVLLVGSNEAVSLDRKRFDSLMEDADLNATAASIGLRSFQDFMDFYISDGARLTNYLQDTPLITDDRPLLEYSSAALTPPLKWQTDESFLNLLQYRIGQRPPLKNAAPWEQERLMKEFEMRSAQRLAVFSKRYEGPGAQEFLKGDYFKGLQTVKEHLEQRGERPISLKDAKWE